MKKYTIAFVGSGKLTKCFANNLLREKKYSRKQFLFVAPRGESDMSWFVDQGFSVSYEYQELEQALLVVLVVTPNGTGMVLHKLAGLFLSSLVSLISNVSVGLLSETTGTPIQNIITGTCNTNVAYGEGIIALAGAKNSQALATATELLSRFGTVEVVSHHLIPRRITTVGSDNAFNSSCLEIIHKRFASDMSLLDWLLLVQQGLHYLAKEHTLDESLDALSAHLQAKAFVWKSNFGYGDLSLQAVRDSFASTVNTLVHAGVNSYEGIAQHITLVATKGGCTESGLGALATYEDLTNTATLARVYLTVHNVVVSLFPKKIEQSFEEYNSKNTALQKIAQAHQDGKYVPE